MLQQRLSTPVFSALLPVVLAIFLSGAARIAAFTPSFFSRTSSVLARQRLAARAVSPRFASVQDVELSKPSEGAQAQSLTQKEYLIAVRNRLFAVEEQICLHEYAVSKPDVSKVHSAPPILLKAVVPLNRATPSHT